MPFGLANALGTFMHLMETVLREYVDQSVIVFLDDILIFSKDPADHMRHVQEVLHVLRENKLYAKFSKCSFGLESIEFPGHIISSTGIAGGPQKTKATKE